MDDIFYWPSRQFASWTGVWPEAFGMKDCEKKLARTNGGYYSINFVMEGAVSLKMAHSPERTVTEGQMFMIPPSHFYQYQAAKKETSLFWIRLTGPQTANYLHLMNLDSKKLLIAVSNPEGVERAIREIYDLYEPYTPASDARAIALLYRLIPTCAEKPARHHREEKCLAQRIRDFMYDELETGYNVSQIATFFGISRSSLFLRFKEEFEENPAEVLQEARIKKAQHLLRETALKVEEIARASGYSSTNHFLHHFKTKTGKTPTAYRKGRRKGIRE